MSRLINLIGRTFGRLRVVERVPANHGRKEAAWRCVCECGGESISLSSNLRSGHTQSCGCYKLERASECNIVHGFAKKNKVLKEHEIWRGIITRCTNKNRDDYERYGGRGITICDKWKNSFESFYKDIGPRPSPRHSVERKDVNGNYEPGNCYWATPEQQSRNTRLRISNKTGCRGVYQRKGYKKWTAVIGVSGKTIHIGNYDTIELAAKARIEAEIKYWGAQMSALSY